MKKQMITSVCGLLGVMATIIMPPAAFAHETHVYEIGNKLYQFTVGSLNEPITVDDATGVELTVVMANSPASHDHDSTVGAVIGLDQTIKVELQAGNEKKVLDLRPKFGVAGVYTAKFYPTVQTTYTYRFFGIIEGAKVDIAFTCNPAGHPQADEDKSRVSMNESVARISKRGAYGCPAAKESLGFPESSASLASLRADIDAIGAHLQNTASRKVAIIALALGLLGLMAGAGAMIKTRK